MDKKKRLKALFFMDMNKKSIFICIYPRFFVLLHDFLWVYELTGRKRRP